MLVFGALEHSSLRLVIAFLLCLTHQKGQKVRVKLARSQVYIHRPSIEYTKVKAHGQQATTATDRDLGRERC